MPLPILTSNPTLTAADLVRLFHRTGENFNQPLGESTALDCGTALVNAEWPDIADANHVWDAALADDQTAAQAVAEAAAHFASAGSVCRYWVLNPAQPAARTEPLAEHLISLGHTPRSTTIYHLHKAPLQRIDGVNLTIIPARASFRHARELALASAKETFPEHAEALADANMARLDEPHWDALLALRDNAAVAQIGVFSVGDMGRIDSLFVLPMQRRAGVARTLIARAMEICARSTFRHIFAEIDPANAATVALARSSGFEPIGSIVRFYRGRE